MSNDDGDAISADLDNLHLVVARADGEGKSHFVDTPAAPLRLSVPGAIEAAMIWRSANAATLPDNLGAVPADVGFALPGETVFGIGCFPPHSADKIDLSVSMEGYDVHGRPEDPGMHRSDTIDYDIILSGKVDLKLDSGEIRTLGPGSCVVMMGAMHAWKNHYDQPCVYAFIQVGVGRG